MTLFLLLRLSHRACGPGRSAPTTSFPAGAADPLIRRPPRAGRADQPRPRLIGRSSVRRGVPVRPARSRWLHSNRSHANCTPPSPDELDRVGAADLAGAFTGAVSGALTALMDHDDAADNGEQRAGTDKPVGPPGAPWGTVLVGWADGRAPHHQGSDDALAVSSQPPAP